MNLGPGFKTLIDTAGTGSLSLKDIREYLDSILAEQKVKRKVKMKTVGQMMEESVINIDFPSLEEVKNSDWYKTRPASIQQMIDSYPPTQYYALNGKQCHIVSYSEDGTLRVQKTGRGGALSQMGLGFLDLNQVFGVEPESLEVWGND